MNRTDKGGSKESGDSSRDGAEKTPLPLLDRAAAAIRTQSVPAQEADSARRRVWQRLQAAQSSAASPAASPVADPGLPINGCGDVRALLGAYRAGTLSPARQLLVQMHLRDCVGCREAQANRSQGRLSPWQASNQRKAPVAAARPARSQQRWIVAAAAVIVLGAGAWLFRDAFQSTPGGPRATLEANQGPVHLLKADGQQVMVAGGSLREREWVRTPRDSRATLRLSDGSRIEMKPHTEVGVSMNRQDVKVHLERGSIIVHAAKRQSGHLIVATDDARVVVTGTVFSVNRGTKGTRISVLEGSVRVDWRGDQRILMAGQQLSTNRFVSLIPIREEVAWSDQVQQHAALLRQTTSNTDVAAAPASPTIASEIRWPQLRYGSKLLPRLPADTLLFVAVPNDKDALDGAKALIDKQMQGNAVLKPWWKDQAAGGAPALGEVFRRARVLSEHLGDEIVLAVSPAQQGNGLRPVVLAEVRRPDLRALLERELAALGARDQIQVLDRAGVTAMTANPAATRPPEAVIMIDGGLVALAPAPADIQRVLSAGAFAETTFGQRLAASYRDGAGLLFAADLGAIAPRAAAGDIKGEAVMQQLGASDARYLVVEQEHLDNSTQNRATVSFAGPRAGVASWLAAPAPMGALDFVTPSASFAAAFVVKEPALVLDDLFRLIEILNPKLREELAQLEARTGIQLRADLAATLGNDLVAAIDGPLLPLPSWKLVMEVSDPARLAQSLERLVGELNRANSTAGRPNVTLTWERRPTSSGVKSAAISSSDTFTLRAPGTPFEAYLVFVDGYMVVAANEPMLQRAVRARQNGQVLRGSWRFRQLLPPDREANFSAVMYHNLGEAASAVAGWLGGTGALEAEQQARLDRLVQDAKPGLVSVYGGSQDIQVASTGGFFGITLDHVLGSAGLTDLLARGPSAGSANPLREGPPGKARLHNATDPPAAGTITP
jgi:ferric-dicitrate binding protein FerR (iron transport regulator)